MFFTDKPSDFMLFIAIISFIATVAVGIFALFLPSLGRVAEVMGISAGAMMMAFCCTMMIE